MSFVTYDRRGHVAILTLNRPERLNAIGDAMSADRNAALADFAADDDAWVLIQTGTGRAFSAGADLKEMAARQAAGDAEPVLLLERTSWKPTIAAVNGLAFGGGFEMALECDIRIGVPEARFALPEASRGMLAVRGAVLLPRIIPAGMALHYLLTGAEMDAATALRLGVVSAVVPADRLLTEAIKLAEQICRQGPLATRAITHVWTDTVGVDYQLARTIAQQLLASEDAAEGVRAFIEKRPPAWRAR